MAVTRHPSIRDQVASILRGAIVNGSLEPGVFLVERELCEMTGASRPSVREALRQLEAEGLLESYNGRGTVVRQLSLEEARHVYEVRAELEGLAARLFCERADEQQKAALQAAVDRLAAASSGPEGSAGVLTAQSEFYGILFEGSGNPFLDQTVQSMQVRIAQLRAITLAVPGRAEQSLAEFQEIAAEIERGRPAAAQRAAVRHVRRASAAMAIAMQGREEGDSVSRPR